MALHPWIEKQFLSPQATQRWQNVEPQNLSHSGDRHINRYNHFGKQFDIS